MYLVHCVSTSSRGAYVPVPGTYVQANRQIAKQNNSKPGKDEQTNNAQINAQLRRLDIILLHLRCCLYL